MISSTYTQWYNDNELRAYPLADGTTGLDDTGLELPQDILVDLSIMLPATEQDRNVRISSVRITSTLVTVGVSDTTGGLMVGTYLRSSITPYVAYPLTAVVADVTGWIVFGAHIAETVENYRFSTYAQSGVERRALRYINPPPVTDMVKYTGYNVTPISGIIRVAGGSGITILAGDTAGTIVVRMDPDMAVLMSGPCNTSASANKCNTPPLKRINGVAPDTTGKLRLEFV